MYKIFFTPGAEKEYRHIAKSDKSIFTRIRNAIRDLAKDPLQGRPLKFGLKNKWSYRVGSYRIIYLIERNILTVYILDIGRRREVYR